MKYKKALVIGKFMNHHLGHVALVDHAQSIADDVIVLVCATPDDIVDPKVRELTIQKTHAGIDVRTFHYQTAGLEGGEGSDVGISKLWAEWVDANLPEVDVIVGSEDYVTYMADHGNFDACIFDMERSKFPMSSTQVRNGNFGGYSEESASHHFKKISIIGGNPDDVESVYNYIANNYQVYIDDEIDVLIDDLDGCCWSAVELVSCLVNTAVKLGSLVSEYDTMIYSGGALRCKAALDAFGLGDSDLVEAHMATELNALHVLVPLPEDPTIDEINTHEYLVKEALRLNLNMVTLDIKSEDYGIKDLVLNGMLSLKAR